MYLKKGLFSILGYPVWRPWNVLDTLNGLFGKRTLCQLYLLGHQRSVISIVLPAKNEAPALAQLLPKLRAAQVDAEIIVVNDGSSDETASLCEGFGVSCITQPYSMGNGAAIKRGARAAAGDVIVFMDGDGQHDPDDVDRLLKRLDDGYDMVVGARDWAGQAGVGRGIANTIYNWLASRMTGFTVRDLTSGFRAVRADKFREFIHLLPNGFSYPTTSTMAFFPQRLCGRLRADCRAPARRQEPH